MPGGAPPLQHAVSALPPPSSCYSGRPAASHLIVLQGAPAVDPHPNRAPELLPPPPRFGAGPPPAVSCRVSHSRIAMPVAIQNALCIHPGHSSRLLFDWFIGPPPSPTSPYPQAVVHWG